MNLVSLLAGLLGLGMVLFGGLAQLSAPRRAPLAVGTRPADAGGMILFVLGVAVIVWAVARAI